MGIFNILSILNIKKLASIGLVIVLGGFVIYEVLTLKNLKEKNDHLKNQITIKNVENNNLKVKNQKLIDILKVKKFETNLTNQKEKILLKNKTITSQDNSLSIKADKADKADKSKVIKVKNLNSLSDGNYTIEIN